LIDAGPQALALGKIFDPRKQPYDTRVLLEDIGKTVQAGASQCPLVFLGVRGKRDDVGRILHIPQGFVFHRTLLPTLHVLHPTHTRHQRRGSPARARCSTTSSESSSAAALQAATASWASAVEALAAGGRRGRSGQDGEGARRK